ncbi:MAG: DUF3137 domain-containing protein [Alphaproteobacteria bacterium]|nr:DUF3137 domain-containing protein [Alphaproteobacteria bacterium]
MIQSDYFSKLRADFDDFYYKNLWYKLVTLEENRIKHLHRFWLLFFLLGIALPLFCLWAFGEWMYLVFTEGSSKDIEGLLKLILLIGAVIVSVIGAPIVAYHTDVKDSIIDDFIGFFGSFKHYFFKKIDDNIITQSQLISGFNRHSGDDYFCGTYKDVRMIISEEHLSKKHNKGESTIFEGIIILLDFPKKFNGQTVVLKDWGHFNFLHTTEKKLERIKLEDIIFEKEFEVYGTDQIEARYLLTTAFMERMLLVRNAFKGKKIQFSFFDSKLFIAINTSKDMFEPASLFKSSTDRRPINDVLEQFISVFSIVEFLKLTQQ